jgi:E3 ubiquitin-protein ligase synoviolin
MPPLSLSPMSAKELAQLEGNERHNVETLIQCLRNINIILDTAMVHMQQFMNICVGTRLVF